MRTIGLLALLAVSAAGQVFEVASVKPGDQNVTEWGINESNNGLTARNSPVRDLVLYAYDAKEYQLSGGPKWLDTMRYTIVAKLEDTAKAPPHGNESDPRLMAAMRALLAERFQLAVHREKKDVPGYALVRGKAGFQLRKVEGPAGSSWTMGAGKAAFHHASLPELAEALAHILGRPVVDESGIEGAYDVTLEWAPDGSTDGGPSIFAALQDVGLKLEARKVQVDLIVIDKAERPGEN
jgi:uncharacterized protein (TIGR03435 family)